MKKIKSLVAAVLVLAGSVTYAQVASEKKVTYEQGASSVIQVLNDFTEDKGLKLLYNKDELQNLKTSAVKCNNISIDACLSDILSGLPLEYRIKDNIVTIRRKKSSEITGNAKDPSSVQEKQIQEVTIVGVGNKASSDKGVLQQQKNTTALLDIMSSDQMKRTSDNNVGQVLKRVAGVTVQDNKFVTVRGMSERYNNVQLNGASLPSSEPNRRNFSFDVVPSGLVDNVIVYKTFTPDLPGEFTGGLVDINTISIPKKAFFNFGLGTGFNTESTGKEFKMGKSFDSDYFLGSSKERDWFGRDWVNSEYQTYYEGTFSLVDREKAAIMNAKVPNHWGLHNYSSAMPTVSYELSAGKPFDLGNGNKLGVVLAGIYRHEETTERTLEAFDRSANKTDFSNSYEFVTAMGAVGNVGWERSGHKITWKNLYNNRFTHSSLERLVRGDSYQPQFEQYSNPVRNTLMQSRLQGEHKITEKLKFDWFADYNKVAREQHNDRLAVGLLASENTENGYMINWSQALNAGIGGIGEGHIMYVDLQENKKNIGGNLTYEFSIKENKQKLKAGYWGTFRKSDFQQQYLRPQKYKDMPGTTPTFGMAAHEFFDPENFRNQTLYYVFAGAKGSVMDGYKGKQDVNAAYALAEFSMLKNKLHINGGVRMEDNKMDINTPYRIFRNAESRYVIVDTLVTRHETDFLPSATLIYDFSKKLSLRAAYGKTLARPDFRELTNYEYYNVYDRSMYSGNGKIKTTRTDNYDVRLEWYPSLGEVISLSAFYKDFNSPVEPLATNPNNAGNFRVYMVNLEGAKTQGLELNIRKNFEFISPILRDFWFTGNGTWLKGDLTFNYQKVILAMYDVVPTDPLHFDGLERTRPLVGLSPYTINAGFAYQGEVFGLGANFNRYGKRVIIAGQTAQEDEYEAPRNAIDLQATAKLWKNKIELKANVSNLLNKDFMIYNNQYLQDPANPVLNDDTDMNYSDRNIVRSRIRKGVGITFSVSYKF